MTPPFGCETNIKDMKWKIAILIVSIFFIVSCKADNRMSSQPTTPLGLSPTSTLPVRVTETVDILSEELAIYTLVITEFFEAQSFYVIEEKAGCPILEMQVEGYADYQKILTALQDETRADYASKIEQEKSWHPVFDGAERFTVVNEAAYWLPLTPDEGLLECSGPCRLSIERLQQEFPAAQGVLHLSPIGYSENGQQALVCVGLNKGGHTKGVEIVLLEKDATSWAINSRFQINSIP